MAKQPTENSVLNYYKIKNYKNIVWINNLDDFVNVFLKNYVTECIMPSNGGRRNKDYVFRGLSSPEQKYSRITTVHYKRQCLSPLLQDKSFVKSFNSELMYIRRFQQNAPKVAISNNSALDLVAMAQHNSLRTRLIDWTRSPLIATLFSLHNAPTYLSKKGNWQNYYLILAANIKDHILAQGLPTPKQMYDSTNIQAENYLIYGEMLKYLTEVYDSDNEDLKKQYFEELLTATNTKYMLNKTGATVQGLNIQSTINKLVGYLNKDRIFFLETNYSNTRIAAQRGLFQLSVNPFKQYIDSCFKNIDLIFILDSARSEILDYCIRLGMNNYALMPDKQSVALEINRKVDEELKKSKK